MNPDALKTIAPDELGRHLAIARRARNFSQEEVAAKLGISRPTLVAIEKGARPVKPDEVILLAQMYGRSVHELVTRREFITDFAPMFRTAQIADVSSEAVDAAVREFQRACEDYLALETLLDAPMPRYQYPEPYASGDSSPQAAAEEAATMERSRLCLGQGPIPNLLDVLEYDIGLRVFVLPLDEFKIAAMFAYTDRLGGCVLVNAKHPRTRQNWSMAHEYAHFLTDRFRQDITVMYDYKRRPARERFADAFAASFLMPAAGLRQRFRRMVLSRNDLTVSDVCLLADQYCVSMEAMTHRLEGLQCVGAGTWERLAAQGIDSSHLRMHLGLSAHKAIHLRLPDRYVRLAVQAYEDEHIGESELMRLLRCSRVEAREIVDELTQPSEMGLSGEMYRLDLDFGASLKFDPARAA